MCHTLINMRGTSDNAIWDYASENNFIIVSKDNDFRQKAFLYGSPPKVIWLSVGNAGTAAIVNLLRTNVVQIQNFTIDPEESLLILELPTNIA